MSNPAPTLNQINAFNATQGTTIDFNIIGGTEVIRSNKIYIYDLSDNSLICTHLYVSTESIHELPPNTSSSIVYASGKSSADFTNNTQYYAQIQTFTDTSGTQGASGLSIAKLFWCLPTPTLTLSTIPTTISTTSYNVSATYTPNTSGSATNEIQEFQFNLYSAIGALLQTSGVVLYGEGVDLSYNFSGLEVDSTYYVTLDVTTTQGMNVSAQSNTFTVSIDTPTIGSASVVNNGCDGYISVTSSLSSEYEHEESSEAGEIMSFTINSVNDIIELDVDFEPVQDDTPWMSTQNTTPYMFRPVPTQTEDFGHESDTIVGGTLGWNQLVQNGNFADTSAWSDTGYGTFTVSNNICTYTITTAQTSARIEQLLTPIVGHKVLSLFEIKCSYDAYVYTTFTASSSTSIAELSHFSTNTWHAVSGMRAIDSSDTTSGKLRLYFGTGASVNDTVQLRNVQLIDLTAYFGSTIADYVYTLESGTAGAGVAWLRANASQLFKYNAYDAGSLVSVNGLTSHDMVGFNQWDEEWENGYINNAGQPASDPTAMRSKNFVLIVPNTTYYGKSPVPMGIRFYDENQTFVGTASVNNATFTTPSDAQYLKFYCANTATYNNDICINLSDASLNGTYEPYVQHSYPLDDSLTLRGIPKIANGKLYYDGDTYESDGTVTRKYGIVDLGSLTWSVYSGGTNTYYASVAGKKYSTATLNNFVQAKYSYSEQGLANMEDKSIRGRTDNTNIYIKDSTYTSASDFKTAMSGIYLVYELTTPTTSLADPYTNPQVVEPHGTEQYVGSPIPVGHMTTYQRICPISGWDSVEVDVSGVNLLPNIKYQEATTRVHVGSVGDFSLVLPAGTYKFSGSAVAGATPYWMEQGGNVQNFNNNMVLTKTTPITIWYYKDGGLDVSDIDWFQLEYGSSASPYQPYQGTTYTSTFPKYKQQVSQDTTPYITKNIGDTYADTLTENLVGGTIAWNQSVPDTTTHTISGSIASMNDAVAGNFGSVVCDIEPVQDLHGYSSPWVGGAGANKWDEQWELGQLESNGTVSPSTTRIVSKNFIPVVAGNEYYMTKYSTSSKGRGAFYDSSYNLIQYFVDFPAGDMNTWNFTVPSGASFLKFCLPSGYGTTYNHDVAVNYPSTVTTYSPYANICPITGWTGCEVDVSGVNVWDEEYQNGYWFVGDGTYHSSGGQLCSKNYIAVVPNTAYYYYKGDGTMNGEVLYFDADKAFISSGGQRGNQGFTTPNNCRFIQFNFGDTYGATYNNDISINYPSTDTAYHAYNGAVYNITWQTEAGTVYGGTVDVVSGVLTVTHETDNLRNVNPNYISEYTVNNKRGVALNYVLNVTSTRADGLCDHAPVTNESNPNLSQYMWFGVNSKYVFWVGILDVFNMTIDEYKTWQSSNDVYIWKELATPTTYQLTGQQIASLLGTNNVWNNVGNTTVTYQSNYSYQSLSITHKYYKRLNGVESISVGSDVVADVGTDNIIDLTQMFGTTIADYIYNIEQSSSSGMGVKFFKSLFPNDDYEYNSGELISVNASAHVIKDANGNVVHTYPLDSDLVLRGIPKLDANNKLYYDGDVYEPDGSVTRKYGVVDLDGSNDEDWAFTSGFAYYRGLRSMTKAGAYSIAPNVKCDKLETIAYGYGSGKDYWISIDNDKDLRICVVAEITDVASARTWLASNPIQVVYELANSTTEQADPFEENQAIVSNGIEEYTVTEQGDVEMPVGHDSTYYATAIYGGTIDMVSGVLTINMASVGLGSLNYSYYGNGIFYHNLNGRASGGQNLICNAYPTSNVQSWSSIEDKAVVGNIANGYIYVRDTNYTDVTTFKNAMNGVQLVYELATPQTYQLTPQQMQTLSGQNNVWSNTNGGMYLVYQLPITSLLVKRRDVADVSGKWLTLYSTPITQASDMDFTFIDFLNQYGKTYQYALVPVLEQDQSGVIVQIEGGYTVSDNVDSIFDGVYIADQTNVERVKAGAGYGNIDMNQGVGSITPIGSKYPIVITNSQNQYHNGSIRGTIVPNDFYSNGNLSRIDMVNKRDELEQFLTNKRAKIIKDWNGKIWLVMIMSNVACSFDDNYGMGMVSFSADWLEVGDPTNQQDLYNAGLINVGGV